MRNKVLVFGDSITYGQRDLEMGGWVNRLRLVIANDRSIVATHVFNMGISGQTVGEVLERIDRECTGRIIDDASNIIVLAAGINDTQVIKGEVLTPESEFRENVYELINHARKHTSNVIYLGLTPVNEDLTNPVCWDRTKNWRNGLIENYDNIIAEICREKGVRYVHVFDRVDAAGNADGLHPSEEGHRVLTEIMTDVVYEYLMTVDQLRAAAAARSAGPIRRLWNKARGRG